MAAVTFRLKAASVFRGNDPWPFIALSVDCILSPPIPLYYYFFTISSAHVKDNSIYPLQFGRRRKKQIRLPWLGDEWKKRKPPTASLPSSSSTSSSSFVAINSAVPETIVWKLFWFLSLSLSLSVYILPLPPPSGWFWAGNRIIKVSLSLLFGLCVFLPVGKGVQVKWTIHARYWTHVTRFCSGRKLLPLQLFTDLVKRFLPRPKCPS